MNKIASELAKKVLKNPSGVLVHMEVLKDMGFLELDGDDSLGTLIIHRERQLNFSKDMFERWCRKKGFTCKSVMGFYHVRL